MQFLVFFYRWIYNLRDYSTYKVFINVFFALNLKFCKILRCKIRSYDLRFHVLSMIIYKILIMTTLNSWVISLRMNISQFCFSFSFFSKVCKTRPSRLPKKKKDDFLACSLASFNVVSSRMWAGLIWCHAPNIVNWHIIWLIGNFV